MKVPKIKNRNRLESALRNFNIRGEKKCVNEILRERKQIEPMRFGRKP